MSNPAPRLDSVCVYCGSSDAADPALLQAASTLGAALAADGLRLVYGGGGVGLMGACARAASAGGGRVLGVMPRFLATREVVLEFIDTVIVDTMHERKIRMFEEADGFAVLPGAIGTVEEVVELLSWRRLGLHAKPIVFYNPGGFWNPLLQLFEQFIDAHLVPPEFRTCWSQVSDITQMIPALKAMPTGQVVPGVMRARV